MHCMPISYGLEVLLAIGLVLGFDVPALRDEISRLDATLRDLIFQVFDLTLLTAVHQVFGRVVVNGGSTVIAADRIPENGRRPKQQIHDADAVFAYVEGTKARGRPKPAAAAGFFSSTT